MRDADRLRRRPGLVLRDRPQLGQGDHHRPGPPRRMAGGTVRRGPLHLRRRLDGRRLPQGDPLHRPGLHVPPAARPPRGLPRLPHRQAVRGGGHDPPRLHRPRRAGSVDQPVLLRSIIRKAFGVAGAANYKPGATHFRYAWPSGDWGSLPIEGGLEVAYKAELAEFDGDAREAEIDRIRERLNRYRSPYRSAEIFDDRGGHRPPRHPPSAVPLGQPGRPDPPARPGDLVLPPLSAALTGRRDGRRGAWPAP